MYTKWQNRIDLKTWSWKIPSLQIKLYGRVFLNRQPGNHIISRLLLVEKSDRFKVTVHRPSVSFFYTSFYKVISNFLKITPNPYLLLKHPRYFCGKIQRWVNRIISKQEAQNLMTKSRLIIFVILLLRADGKNKILSVPVL